MTRIPPEARAILRSGTLCYLAAPSPSGPHVTPLVFAVDRSRVWVTTSRSSVKARVWRRDPRAAGLVQAGDRAVAFRGAVTMYDALDPFTWPAVLFRGPALARASTRFTLKNARYFAGYARDARRVPLSWTPPGRIVVSVDVEDAAVLDVPGGEVVGSHGRWGSEVASGQAFRASRRDPFPDGRMPDELNGLLSPHGRGVLGVPGAEGPVVLPAIWTRAGGSYYAILPRPLLALADPSSRAEASLVVDRASAWRAARMAGLLLRGPAEVFVPRRLRTGRESLLARIRPAGPPPKDPAVVRLRPSSAVWWSGWSSGTVPR